MSTPPARRRYAALGSLALAALLLCGCGTSGKVSGPVGWQPSRHPVDVTGPIWARGGDVHLADGTVIATGTALARYVVAGDGVYFVKGTAEEAAGKPVDLDVATPDGVGSTGELIDPTTLHASADGRYVGFVAEDRDEDENAGSAVVVDLTTARKVVQTTAGHVQDLLGLTDGAAYVRTLGGVDTYRLADGRRTGHAADLSRRAAPWRTGATTRIEWNRGHTWAIQPGRPDGLLRHSRGRSLRPRAGEKSWMLVRWLDDTTAIGFAYNRPVTKTGGIDTDAEATLMTCRVPSGSCRRVPGTAGGIGSVTLPAPPLG